MEILDKEKIDFEFEYYKKDFLEYANKLNAQNEQIKYGGKKATQGAWDYLYDIKSKIEETVKLNLKQDEKNKKLKRLRDIERECFDELVEFDKLLYNFYAFHLDLNDFLEEWFKTKTGMECPESVKEKLYIYCRRNG